MSDTRITRETLDQLVEALYQSLVSQFGIGASKQMDLEVLTPEIIELLDKVGILLEVEEL